MGARMRAFDWSPTALGLVEHWPLSLRACARIVLGAGHPMFISWGPANAIHRPSGDTDTELFHGRSVKDGCARSRCPHGQQHEVTGLSRRVARSR